MYFCVFVHTIQILSFFLFTGCDSGFGHRLAKRLDSVGYQVFAGCLDENSDGAKELKRSCSSRLQVVEVDVTKDASVSNAVSFVEENLGTSGMTGYTFLCTVLEFIEVTLRF